MTPGRQSLICILTVFMVTFSPLRAGAQSNDPEALFPVEGFLPQIESPASFFGFQPGEWHLTPDQIHAYGKYLSQQSDRVMYFEYARTHEQKPVFVLQISTPENLRNIDRLREQHIKSITPGKDQDDRTDDLLVLYQGYSIHGDEASGSNAAIMVAYYLAAGTGSRVEALLENAIILLDPCQNPDGLGRFATWVNAHKNEHPSANDSDREFNQDWPGGRTNHYWFDLNRDWLLLQHPESRGKVRLLQMWKPHIVTDHHEMGSSSTFFFMPGVPERTNPITPDQNQELTARIAEYHAEALDRAGVLYYSKEGFDDFYYGKGSTYPDANGGIGILFEQAGTEGHLRKTQHGYLSLSSAMKNQIITSLSTQKAAIENKEALIEYQQWFYRSGIDRASADKVSAYTLECPRDPARLQELLRILIAHGIEVEKVKGEPTGSDLGKFVVRTNQAQYRMIRSVFERHTVFTDSIFYDVSSWTLPLAFGIESTPLDAAGLKQLKIEPYLLPGLDFLEDVSHSDVGYLIDWNHHFAPGLVYALQDEGYILSLLGKYGRLSTYKGEVEVGPGTLFVRAGGAKAKEKSLHTLIQELSMEYKVPVLALKSGFARFGPDLGSNSHTIVRKPQIGLLIGDGISSYEAGEMWHLMDNRYGIPVTKLDVVNIKSSWLEDLNTLILPGGSYQHLSDSFITSLQDWVKGGGTLILSGRSVSWASAKKIISVKTRNTSSPEAENDELLHYSDIGRGSGSDRVSGTIMGLQYDPANPLCYGLGDQSLAVMRRGKTIYEPTENSLATPVRFLENSLLSGYLPRGFEKEIAGSASLMAFQSGRGRIIAMTDNYAFRSFFWGSEKLIANAVFFAPYVSGQALQRIVIENARD